MVEHFSGKVGVKAIITRKGAVLMVRASNETYWDLPGGRINEGERLTDALVREIQEELGVLVVVGQFIHSCQVVHSQDRTNQLFLTFCIAALGTFDFTIPTDEVAEIRWVSEAELPDLVTYDNCRSALEYFWK